MEMTPQIFMAKTMHKRFFPRENHFVYSVYYLALPLSQLKKSPNNFVFRLNRFALFSFYEKDYGPRDGSDLQAWAINLFKQHSVVLDGCEIMLFTMPRILGYAFNPVSFWMCCDAQKNLRAVIAEVNNTFGETHSYLCVPHDGTVIDPDGWLKAEKLFHVSPFLERKGDYVFRFNAGTDKVAIWIDYFVENNKKQLTTSLIGTLQPFSNAALLKAFLAIPFVTIKTIVLIHWQALVLAFKKIRYIDKPEQLNVRSSRTTENLTKK
jgi:uncharacterized protein